MRNGTPFDQLERWPKPRSLPQDYSRTQRLAALNKANIVYRLRAQYFRELGELPKDEAMARLAAVLDDIPWFLQTVTVMKTLVRCRRIGRFKALMIITPLHIPENKQLGTLTPGQCRKLSGALGRPIR